MRNKQNTYCTYEFWEKFFSLEFSRELRSNRDKRRAWLDFYSFLENCNIHFDIEKTQIDFETDGGRSLLEMSGKRGGAHITYMGNSFPSFTSILSNDNDRLNAVYLCTLDDSECENLSNKYGIIAMNVEMVFSSNHLYQDNGGPLAREALEDWGFLADLSTKCPGVCHCNSLIITDRYLFANDGNATLDKNLTPILDSLLPRGLEEGIVFTISILCERKEGYPQQLSFVKDKIRSLRPSLNFTLTVYFTYRIHDRSILTNNIMLTSGAGFDTLNENGNLLRWFTITGLVFPFFQPNRSNIDGYLVWIKNVLKVCNYCRQKGYYDGDEIDNNHLLGYYQDRPKPHRSTFLSKSYSVFVS